MMHSYLGMALLCLAFLLLGASNGQTPSTPTTKPTGDVSSLIPESLYEEMLKHRGEGSCYGGFYNYKAFITASRSFPGFATIGDTITRKRVIAAFFAQTSHATTGGWDAAPDEPFAWGYCSIEERGENRDSYCKPDKHWPCVRNRKYFGRGPMLLKWNYQYGPAGRAIGVDLLDNPDLVIGDPVVSFKTALWYWMSPQFPKPSPHDAITGRWNQSMEDWGARRVTGFGLTTNIINGYNECGTSANEMGANRIGFYRRYCSLLGVGPGDNLDCYMQRPYQT